MVGRPIVENCVAGYNSCVMAYGQTGSGKTHTMLGDIPQQIFQYKEQVILKNGDLIGPYYVTQINVVLHVA